MPTMLKMTSYDTICHEHLEYYSLAVIEYILREAGLRLVNVGLNASNGGSIRVYATHAANVGYRRDEFTREHPDACASKSSTCSSTPTSRTGTSRSA